MPNHTVILTHEHADFDALASLLGAALLFPGTIPVLPRTINRNGQAFLALYRSSFSFVEPERMPRGQVEQAILVDTRTFNALKGMDETTHYLLIDHHSHTESLPDGWRWWDGALGPLSTGANTTLLVEKLMVQGAHVTPIQSTLLALGIYEDTGGLLYSSTTHRDARCVAWLLEEGAKVEVIHRFTHYPLSPAQQSLGDDLIANAEHVQVAGQTLVVATASAPDFRDEVSALAHKLRELYETDAVFVLVDLGDRVQMVARSRSDGVDVGAIAAALGGGGHSRAAAALIRGGVLADVRAKILEMAGVSVRPPLTVREMMSRGRPQTLPPEMAVGEAAKLMRRYGFEGFPVVRTLPDGRDKLLGILLRRDADRATDHGLDKRPVERLMKAGSVTIGPDAPITELHRLMIESGWGQIPVVDGSGRIIGIVTRTDLIKLWGKQTEASHSLPDVSRHLAEHLTPIQHRLLRLVGEMATEYGHAVYVVGGFARDLLLDRIRDRIGGPDMDIVVEGDAIALLEAMQARCGGRIVTHRRFGTAKWLLDEPAHPIVGSELLAEMGVLPAHLDLVTARTEFYTEPTVLPTVEQGSIKLDLHRRDFTINTLAIVLTPDRWGDLLDFYGGLADLRLGLIRVLHSLSFVDDPTRILRAVRYEQRFDFRIEERTLELLMDAVPLVDRVSPARIRHELDRIFQEAEPCKALFRMDQLGVLAAIYPQLATTPALAAQCEALRLRLATADPSLEETGEAIERLYWGLLVYPLLPSQGMDADEEVVSGVIGELTERLKLRGETTRLMLRLAHLKAHRDEMTDPSLRPSRAVEILDRSSLAARLLFGLAENDPVIDSYLRRFQDEWRHIRPTVTGRDLAGLGIRPGPVFGHILRHLSAALLDGEIAGEAAERRLLAALIEDLDEERLKNR
ncbi:MAG: CBS domain-containing protein [Chloroflexi bacterium]|nr:MAG: CBS domain-containing protein [Chloroflexota bacterium]